MKKIYIQPDIEEIDVETESLLQVVSAETGTGNVWGNIIAFGMNGRSSNLPFFFNFDFMVEK